MTVAIQQQVSMTARQLCGAPTVFVRTLPQLRLPWFLPSSLPPPQVTIASTLVYQYTPPQFAPAVAAASIVLLFATLSGLSDPLASVLAL